MVSNLGGILAGIAVLLHAVPLRGGELEQTGVDWNSVLSIKSGKREIRFQTTAGELSFDRTARAWRHGVDLALGDVLGTSLNLDVASLPEHYPRQSYVDINASFLLNGTTWLLTSDADEGAIYGQQHVVDLGNRVLYELPYEAFSSCSIDETTIWLGSPDGITGIERASGRRIDYRTLPSSSTIIAAFSGHGRTYFLSNDQGLAVYRAGRGLEPVAGIGPFDPPGYRYFDAIVRGENLFVLGSGMDPVGDIHSGGARVFKVNFETGQSTSVPVGLDYADKLVQIGSRIFGYGSLVEGYEGGDYAMFGGMFLVAPHPLSVSTVTNTPIALLVGTPLRGTYLNDNHEAGVATVGSLDFSDDGAAVLKRKDLVVDVGSTEFASITSSIGAVNQEYGRRREAARAMLSALNPIPEVRGFSRGTVPVSFFPATSELDESVRSIETIDPAGAEGVRRLVDALAHKDEQVRLAAASRLAKSESSLDPHAGAIFHVMQGASPELRERMVALLDRLSAAPVPAGLVNTLESELERTRLYESPRPSADLLIRLGERGKWALYRVIDHGPVAAKKDSLNAVHNRGVPIDILLPAILRCLEGEEMDVARDAARALGRAFKTSAAVEGLLRAARRSPGDSKFGWIRVEAVRSLGLIGLLPEDTVPVLIGALTDHDAGVRHAAAEALARFGPKASPAVPALLRAAERGNHQGVVVALGQIGPAAKDAVPQLIAALQEADQAVITAAVFALGNIGLAASPAVPALERLDPLTYRALPGALMKLGPEGVVATWRLVDHELKPVREEARRAFEALPIDEQSLSVLARMLSDGSPRQRAAAARALGKPGSDNGVAARLLIGMLDQETECDARNAAAYALGGLGHATPDVLSSLRRAIAIEREEGCDNDSSWSALNKLSPIEKWEPLRATPDSLRRFNR